MFASGKVGGMKMMSRGVIAAADFRLQDLTFDGSYYTLDLSGIVPIGTKFVCLGISVISTDIGNQVVIKEIGQAEYYGDWRFICSVGGQSHMSRQWFALNDDLEVTYACSIGAWVTLNISVVFWMN